MTSGPSDCALLSLRRMQASDVMSTEAITVTEHETLASAWEILARAGCRFLPVVRGSRVVGVIDDHAVVCARTTKWLDGRPRLVGEAARPARTVHRETPVTEVIERLHRESANAIVVVDDQQAPLGIITPEALLALVDSVLAHHVAQLADGAA